MLNDNASRSRFQDSEGGPAVKEGKNNESRTARGSANPVTLIRAEDKKMLNIHSALGRSV
jgi:hypothetical protein